MKLNILIIALPILGSSSLALANTTHERLFTPQAAVVERVHHHGVEDNHNERAPIARVKVQPQQLNNVMLSSQAIMATCDLNALASANS